MQCRNRRLTRKRTDTQNRGVCTKNDELCGSRNKHVRSQIQLKSLERLSAHNRVETEEKGATVIKMQEKIWDGLSLVTNQEHNVAAMVILETRDDTSCLSQTYLETVRILGWPRRSSSNSGVEVQRMSTVPFLFGLHSQICRWRTCRNATDFDKEYRHRRSCLATASDFLYSTNGINVPVPCKRSFWQGRYKIYIDLV